MARYRSKPSDIEAVLWDGLNHAEVVAFAGDKIAFDADGNLSLKAGKDGVQGWVSVPVGHWLVCIPDDKSDIWPVENGYFLAKYEPVLAKQP